ncbi:MAG: hypothetical protein EBR81_18005, partial [Proteobacteria bacterium]|nr:hypothetical protein [Pseudomonadota bacterium]
MSADHTALCGVENHLHAFLKTSGEKLAQPRLAHRRREGQQHLPFRSAALDFANLARHKKRRVLHNTLARKHSAPTMHQLTTQRRSVHPQGHLIRKARQHAPPHRFSRGRALIHPQTLRPRDAQKLIRQQIIPPELVSIVYIDRDKTYGGRK